MTPYSEVFSKFKTLIIRDVTFFKNIDVDKVLSDRRCLSLMDSAITNMYLTEDSKDMPINFIQLRDDGNMTFVDTLNDIEVGLIAYFMWQCYVDEEFVLRFKELRRMGFSDKEITMFSPNETLKQFTNSYNELVSSNIKRLNKYKRIDRNTLKYNRFDYNFN